jgi:hypothetical protein
MTGQISPADDYSEKLIKLLPAEGIAALTTINGIIELDDDNKIWMGLSFLVVGAFVALWAMRVRQVGSAMQLAFILLAYVLWASSILWPWLKAYVPQLADAQSSIPAVLSILFTLFIPFVFAAPAPAKP